MELNSFNHNLAFEFLVCYVIIIISCRLRNCQAVKQI